MQFIIFDLEWNNTYCKQTKKGINEIIEIGAVRLDEALCERGSFSRLIRAAFGKKLHERVTALTHITSEDLRGGTPFLQVMEEFGRWIGEEPAVFLSWSNTDLYVLVENLKIFTGGATIPFLKRYADLQRYCQAVMNTQGNNQISLLHAARQLGIHIDEATLHRALDDCRLSAKCFEKTYNPQRFEPFVTQCDERFYGIMAFKPYIISDFTDPAVDKTKLFCTCEACNRQMKRVSKWEFQNQSFRAVFQCGKCQKKSRLVVRVKKYYDRVDTKIRSMEIKDKRHSYSGVRGK